MLGRDTLLILIMVVEVLVIWSSLQILTKKQKYGSIKAMLLKIIIITIGVVMMYTTKYLLVGSQGTILDDMFGSITMFDVLVGVLSVVITLDIFKIGLDIQEYEKQRKVDDELKYIVKGYKGLLEEIEKMDNHIETIVLLEFKVGKKYYSSYVHVLKRGLDYLYAQIQDIKIFILDDKATNLTSDLRGILTDIWRVTDIYQKEIEGYLKSTSLKYQTQEIAEVYKEYYETLKDIESKDKNVDKVGRNFYTDMYEVNKQLKILISEYLKVLEGHVELKDFLLIKKEIEKEQGNLEEYIESELSDNKILTYTVYDLQYPDGEGVLKTIEEGCTALVEYKGTKHGRQKTFEKIHTHTVEYNVRVKALEVVDDYKNMYVDFETLIVLYEKVSEPQYFKSYMLYIVDKHNGKINKYVQKIKEFQDNYKQGLVLIGESTGDLGPYGNKYNVLLNEVKYKKGFRGEVNIVERSNNMIDYSNEYIYIGKINIKDEIYYVLEIRSIEGIIK